MTDPATGTSVPRARLIQLAGVAARTRDFARNQVSVSDGFDAARRVGVVGRMVPALHGQQLGMAHHLAGVLRHFQRGGRVSGGPNQQDVLL